MKPDDNRIHRAPVGGLSSRKQEAAGGPQATTGRSSRENDDDGSAQNTELYPKRFSSSSSIVPRQLSNRVSRTSRFGFSLCQSEVYLKF